MKEDWNRRARENACYYVATTAWQTEEVFAASGERDVGLFFSGLVHLLHAKAVVLDVGCGIGRMDRWVAPHVRQLIGLDVSGEMLARARERLRHVANARFVEGDGWSLASIASSSIDLVFSHIVFQHVPRTVFAAYLPEVARVLKPGGAFVFQLPELVGVERADPPGDDTFEMRFYGEDQARELLAAQALRWRSLRRFRTDVVEAIVNYLVIHAEKPA